MWHRNLRTDRRLWLAFAVVLFVAAGFVEWIPGKAGHYWNVWGRFLTQAGSHGRTPDLEWAGALVVWGLLFMLPAAAVGWVLQAIVVAATGGDPGQPRDEPNAPHGVPRVR